MVGAETIDRLGRRRVGARVAKPLPKERDGWRFDVSNLVLAHGDPCTVAHRRGRGYTRSAVLVSRGTYAGDNGIFTGSGFVKWGSIYAWRLDDFDGAAPEAWEH